MEGAPDNIKSAVLEKVRQITGNPRRTIGRQAPHFVGDMETEGGTTLGDFLPQQPAQPAAAPPTTNETETWLSPQASVPFRPHIANLMTLNLNPTAGGCRATGGLLAFASPGAPKNYRVIFEDKDSCYMALQVGDVVLIPVYLAPAQPDTKLQELLVKAEELSDRFSKRCVVFGDLNARIGEESGDSMTNPRGRLLLDELTNSQLSLQRPVEGKWTTFAGAGCGITDLVLANFDITTVKVHELESLGGSDHRPVTFSLDIDNTTNAKDFTHWNVRRLASAQHSKAYEDALANSSTLVLSQLVHLDARMEACKCTVGGRLAASGPVDDPISAPPTVGGEFNHISDVPGSHTNEVQSIIDTAWTLIKLWIEAAAEATIGTVHVKDHLPEEFWTDELEDTREMIRDSIQELQDGIIR
ncbi:hypothetical protein BDR26DRAFT_962721 [Obelidium mucronatum]|nr:hypothetical protein BDR26DRAFT_962721 [Obelidium mucronatum]